MIRGVDLPPHPPESRALMNGGGHPLPLRRSLVVSHEIVDIVQQRLGLGEVGVTQQVDVEVRDGHRVDAGSHGVGQVITGAGGVVPPEESGVFSSAPATSTFNTPPVVVAVTVTAPAALMVVAAGGVVDGVLGSSALGRPM